MRRMDIIALIGIILLAGATWTASLALEAGNSMPTVDTGKMLEGVADSVKGITNKVSATVSGVVEEKKSGAESAKPAAEKEPSLVSTALEAVKSLSATASITVLNRDMHDRTVEATFEDGKKSKFTLKPGSAHRLSSSAVLRMLPSGRKYQASGVETVVINKGKFEKVTP